MFITPKVNLKSPSVLFVVLSIVKAGSNCPFFMVIWWNVDLSY